MLCNGNKWEKLGRIVEPDPAIWWMVTHAGSAFAQLVDEDGQVDLYVAGRDRRNRSHIGRIRFNLATQQVEHIAPNPVIPLGKLGTFDENGMTYPWLVRDDDTSYLFYTGWMPSVLTPFQNHLGLARRDGPCKFVRVSRAPILPRDNDDYLSIGSSCCVIEDGVWRLWYTSWTMWGSMPDEPKHRYLIKYAESADGRNWQRSNTVCIGPQHHSEHSICRPSVLKIGDQYHMWYSVRGDNYQIGYAISADGITWERRDELANIAPSDSGWDSQAQAYAHVFQWREHLYMIYNGNQYGRDGLGLARLAL